MRSVADIERVAGITWSPDERTTVAGWAMASSGGFTRRTNCATPTASSDTNPEARGAVESWLTERGAQLVVRVTPLADPQIVGRVLDSWGLCRTDETVVMTKRILAEKAGRLAVVDPSDAVFAAELLAKNGRPPDAVAAWRRMVRRLGDDAAGIWEKDRAVGLATVAGSMAAIYSVAVDSVHRRHGLATEVMSRAEAWAGARGATVALLQVREDNDAARAMYDKLGYRERYRYHYLQPQATSV